MNERKLLDELRSWVTSEMQCELKKSGEVHRSDWTRTRSIIVADAYRRVLQRMESIQNKAGES